MQAKKLRKYSFKRGLKGEEYDEKVNDKVHIETFEQKDNTIDIEMKTSVFREKDQFFDCPIQIMNWFSNFFVNKEYHQNYVGGVYGEGAYKGYEEEFSPYILIMILTLYYSLLMPEWVYITVSDKESRVREIMRMLGLKSVPYSYMIIG